MMEKNSTRVNRTNKCKTRRLGYSSESTRRCIAALTTIHKQLEIDSSVGVSALEDQSRSKSLSRNSYSTHFVPISVDAATVSVDSVVPPYSLGDISPKLPSLHAALQRWISTY